MLAKADKSAPTRGRSILFISTIALKDEIMGREVI